MHSYGFHVQSPDGQSNGMEVCGPNMPWYTAPMMLVSLTLSIARQFATSPASTLTLQGLTVALAELDTRNALPPRIHVVRPGGTNNARLVWSRDRPRIELYDLLRKWVHRDSQYGNDSTRGASKCSPMNAVNEVQSTPGPPAGIVKDLKFYEATWTAFKVLPFELAEGLTDYHEHR